MRLPIFILLELVLFPSQILAVIAYGTKIKRRTNPAKICPTDGESTVRV